MNAFILERGEKKGKWDIEICASWETPVKLYTIEMHTTDDMLFA